MMAGIAMSFKSGVMLLAFASSAAACGWVVTDGSDEKCCEGDSPCMDVGAYCSESNTCQYYPCGWDNEECCDSDDTSDCWTENYSCNKDNICEECGGKAQPVCDNGQECEDGLYESYGICRQEKCGGGWQICCEWGDACDEGLECIDGMKCMNVENCGLVGENICPWADQPECNFSENYLVTFNKCRVCGSAGKQACTNGTACEDGLMAMEVNGDNYCMEATAGDK